MPSEIRGYTDRQSVAQGDTIGFSLVDLAGSARRATVTVVRLGVVEKVVAAATADIPAGVLPAAGWENNGWPIAYEQRIGRDWQPGVYAARFGETGHPTEEEIFFVVRGAAAQSAPSVVVQLPTTTINAYNNWGGASLYPYNSQGRPATAVSFARPQRADARWPRGYGFKEEWDLRVAAFVRWLEAMGYAADFITDNDLHAAPLPETCRLFISIGHDEYWSREMRAHFDAFVHKGGNAAILGGNTCYWQIRLETDEHGGKEPRREVCYRSAAADPIADAALKTVLWRDLGLPENLSFGAGFAKGAWRGAAAPGAFTVHRPEHWLFGDTGLRAGDSFGGTPDEPLLGYETNGVDYVLDDAGRPIPTGSDGTPASFSILALADLPHWGTPGNAALGIFAHPTSGGTVFNAATTDWAKGFEVCHRSGDLLHTVTARITRNMIDRLSQPRASDAADRR